MENQLTAIGPTYIQDFREFGVMPFQASHMDDIEVAFLTVYLSDVRIEFGAMHGEDIHTVDASFSRVLNFFKSRSWCLLF